MAVMCSRCKQSKPETEFYKNTRMTTGFTSYCKLCYKETASTRHSKNKTHNNTKAKEWKLNNKNRVSQYNKAYRQEHLLTEKLRFKEYYNNNISKMRSKSLKRQYCKQQATVSWANTDLINAIYAMSKWLSCVVPNTIYHVDHIVPLQHNKVCGLHVETNLQIIPQSMNLSKSNTFEV